MIRSQLVDQATIVKIPIPYTLAEILELGENGKFPKRIFIFGGKRKAKTPVTHFYKIKSKYSQNEIGNRKREFECLICQNIRNAPFKDLSNLIKHLRTHKETESWVNSFCCSIGRSKSTLLSREDFELANFFLFPQILV